MFGSSIGWILVISGIPAAAAGFFALLFPQTILGKVFGLVDANPVTIFFTRHWGALLFVVCSLTVYAALFPDTRGPILTAAVVEKLIVFLLIFFGKLARTPAIAIIAIADGLLAVVFTAYLIGH